MKKKILVPIIIVIIILLAIGIYFGLVKQEIVAEQWSCSENSDSNTYIKMCYRRSFDEVKIIDGVGRLIYTDGDYIEVACGSPYTSLYLGTTTGQCDESGCSGAIVSNPYKYYLKELDNLQEFNFVCYYNDGEDWNRMGVNLGNFAYVECKTNFDCPLTSLIEYYCDGDNFMEEVTYSGCVNNACVEDTGDHEINIVEECDYQCGDVNGVYQCIDEPPPTCEEGEKKCSGDNVLICEDDEFKVFEECEKGCENSECIKDNILTQIIIAGLIIFVISIAILIIIKRKKK